MLGTNSAAYQPINAGNTYIGNAAILGREYITGYEPIFTPNTKEVIGILFVGIEMSSVHEMIDKGCQSVRIGCRNKRGHRADHHRHRQAQRKC
jgi:methyl-accepting chemotaxis protein